MKSITSSSLAASAAVLGKALAATSGEFSVLSMNVAGLPAIFNSNDVPGDKATNAGSIGTKFAEYGYDIIHVQEVGIPTLSTSGQNPASSLAFCRKYRC